MSNEKARSRGRKSSETWAYELNGVVSDRVFSPSRSPVSEPAITDSTAAQIKDRFSGNTPRPHGFEKLNGTDQLYRIRVGDYRIVYAVEDERLLVLVVKVGHRREVYR